MRRLIPVVLCSIAFLAQAEGLITLPSVHAVEGVIDLDKPGALEALQRDNPKHYEAVMKKVEQAQTVEYSDKGTHDLGLFPQPGEGNPMAHGYDLKLSDPAQARIRVFVEDTAYAITVRYTKDPAQLVPAR